MKSYIGKLFSSVDWWLAKRRPFIINDEYKVELLHINTKTFTAKVRFTNLKTEQSVEQEANLNEQEACRINL